MGIGSGGDVPLGERVAERLLPVCRDAQSYEGLIAVLPAVPVPEILDAPPGAPVARIGGPAKDVAFACGQFVQCDPVILR